MRQKKKKHDMHTSTTDFAKKGNPLFPLRPLTDFFIFHQNTLRQQNAEISESF
jgi:hypothetical protein